MALMTSRELRELSLRIAGEAAGLLRDIREDKGLLERVSENRETIFADKESEEYIIESLRAEGFEGHIISEEIGYVRGNTDVLAVIDPLDGSRNYKLGIPWCSVSLAFIDLRSSKPGLIAGTVHPIYALPPLSFYRGGGVYRGGERIRKETVRELLKEDEIYSVYEDMPGALEAIERFYEAKRNAGRRLVIRSLGSAALELAFTGIGVFKAFIDVRSKLRIVDIAAGLGIILENGGYFGDLRGEEPSLSYNSLRPVGSIIASLYKEEIDFLVSLLRNYT